VVRGQLSESPRSGRHHLAHGEPAVGKIRNRRSAEPRLGRHLVIVRNEAGDGALAMFCLTMPGCRPYRGWRISNAVSIPRLARRGLKDHARFAGCPAPLPQRGEGGVLELKRGMHLNLHPSPPWGRGWLATGVFISRGETGEGVKTVSVEGAYASKAMYAPPVE